MRPNGESLARVKDGVWTVLGFSTPLECRSWSDDWDLFGFPMKERSEHDGDQRFVEVVEEEDTEHTCLTFSSLDLKRRLVSFNMNE